MGKINGLPKKEWIRVNNNFRYAKRKVIVFLKQRGYSYYKYSQFDALKIFAKEIGEPLSFTKRFCRKWLVDLYHSDKYDEFKRGEVYFYTSPEWLKLRKLVLKKYGEVCMKCGGNKIICVDHIKPRSLYPELELDFDNMQVLCSACNLSKSNRNTIDYRKNNLPTKKP